MVGGASFRKNEDRSTAVVLTVSTVVTDTLISCIAVLLEPLLVPVPPLDDVGDADAAAAAADAAASSAWVCVENLPVPSGLVTTMPATCTHHARLRGAL